MRAYNYWNKAKTEELISFVDKHLKQGESAITAFKEYSKIININPYTIRNVYYKKVKELGIEKKKNISFKCEETNELITKVDNLLNQGYSVRCACLKLANNNKTLFLRYQNKYWSTKKNGANKNVITIRQRTSGLSEEDINNLLKGVVNLIKKSAVYEISQKYKNIISEYNVRLNNTLIELNKKNNLLNAVLAENEILKNEKGKNLNSLLSKIKV